MRRHPSPSGHSLEQAGDILGATAKLIEEQRMELPEFQFAKLHALVEKELSKMKS